ncbi:hypothetical protein ABB37_09459 [Leptomonas pyrrhocoris]|uniref:EB1 C-terminal domain-containing protein n=1 Tax=Leptomonas pyrrhocoris TaxID=157538 RepID=A0A0M9FR69_LEPPY|nr:hypothetical protein ABB37_09459 [Leptomonas pyrrhocoris]XP_015652645.1 hypothetical protein ABB37_09459 [Leptomonas pyrrhocoris]KPA74205.1 hypothetical protein ABB37_09459 [Leptomonas pyrrhocoris]KPA74206.1 hypothetical protein ABB37_09459 [Leptomonas pyrrhocoris]|eukprot:XP_015652644.1 hypothetical protein ABB37_09459 [Leptomonas pyrrhocoris]
MLRNLQVVPATEPWSEMLEWVNRSMPIEAPNRIKTPMMLKVEDCGHGVPYALMLPTMLPIVHTPLLTSKVKVPAKTDYEAAANLKIIQDALRRNGIVIPDVLANSQQKLIGRNFQANLQLLQWFRGLYVALQQCGIEAGEGRIVLAAPSNEDSILSLGSPPASVLQAEDRRRSSSVNGTKSESQVLREAREADAKGDAAAAAAVAIVSEHRTHSQNRSRSRNSVFEATILNSANSSSLPVHRQQVPTKLSQQQQQQQQPQQEHNSIGGSRREERGSLEDSLVKSMISPLPAPPLATAPPLEIAPRASPAAPQPQPPVATKKEQTPAARAKTPSQTRKASGTLTRPSLWTGAQATSTAEPPTVSTETAKPNAAVPRRSSATRRPPSQSAATGANGLRTPHRAESSTASTRARSSITGRNSVVFKPVPARLSVGSSARRQPSERSGGTPRAADGAAGSTRGVAGSLRGSTPKRSAAENGGDRVAAPSAVANGTSQHTASRSTKPATKPIIALSKTTPAAPRQSKSPISELAAAPASAPAPVPPLSTNNTAVGPPSSEHAANVDVLQLQVDRQFYYDKLRSIEELVECMEAKKKQERQSNAKAWDSKDDEMMDFTNSVRSVLYAES